MEAGLKSTFSLETPLRTDHRPYPLKKLYLATERAYVNHFISPQLDSLGDEFLIMKPWNFKVHGEDIHIGRSVHIVTAADRRVTLTTWKFDTDAGEIQIGDYCLLCPGVRLDAACGIHIGHNSMLASSVYITDADWHDIYDRTLAIGKSAPVHLGNNVWIGDSSIICKGVNIGDNTVIGAGSIVTHDIPGNVIAAGNPAKVIKPLDPDKEIRKREALLADPTTLNRQTDSMNRYLLGNNTWLRWLRSVVRPDRTD